MKLLARGLSQAEVARRCGVSETSVYRWKEAQARKGPGAWKRGIEKSRVPSIHLRGGRSVE